MPCLSHHYVMLMIIMSSKLQQQMFDFQSICCQNREYKCSKLNPELISGQQQALEHQAPEGSQWPLTGALDADLPLPTSWWMGLAQTPITGHLEKSGYPYLQGTWNLEIMVSKGGFSPPPQGKESSERLVKNWNHWFLPPDIPSSRRD